MSKKQPSIIEKILRTSKNPNRIILNAFKSIPTENLSRFAQVSLNHFLFRDSYVKNVEKRKLSEFETFRQATFLKDTDDIKFFHYCHGIISSNIKLVKDFSSKERFLNSIIFSGELADALNN